MSSVFFLSFVDNLFHTLLSFGKLRYIIEPGTKTFLVRNIIRQTFMLLCYSLDCEFTYDRN